MELKVRFFNPGLIYKAHEEQFDKAIKDVLTRGDLILRKDLEVFEAKFAEILGVKYVVGVASGTDALMLSLKALGIGEGDEVMVPSYTFRATIEAVCNIGAKPMLYDIDGKVEFRAMTQAIIPAYIAGEVPPGAKDVIAKARELGIAVVEDACQAVTAAPVLGDTACYSFYPAKILGCFGDGGAIATDNEELYLKLKAMRNHFKGDWKPVGYNSRLDNLQAAVLNVALENLGENLKARMLVARRYDAELLGGKKAEVRAVYQDYILELDDEEQRDALHTHLLEQGVETLKNEYPFPEVAPKLPGAVAYESRTLRLPCNQILTDDEVGYVINAVNSFFQK